ncbi:hypothetical protein IC235_07840 [Hymenobacter sp. BT664]|uniref:Uncharacterized protein n=1 Tax=Hymenobacter montanus TaxID=2771359 RepID=A0A927GIU8_9BACT|nr:hypothetical protein [Hymenobacter montanus]MBD2767802.1 hypothetical protein [Hymenobacter montanus]
MRVFLAIVLNAALLAVLLPWVRRQWLLVGPGWWRYTLGLGLGLRVLVGVARSWEPKEDAKFMSTVGQLVTTKLWTRPDTAWQVLFGASNVFRIKLQGNDYEAIFHNLSNTWFLIKLLALLNLGSLRCSWLNGLYLSIFAFVGCWHLVRKLPLVFPSTPAGAATVAFLLWPSVWFWAAGISKEAVLLGSGAWLTARVLGYLYGEPGRAPYRIGWWLGTVALAVLHFQMRYFFAAPLLGILAGVALVRVLKHRGLVRQRWAQALVPILLLGSGVWLASQVSVAFSINKFTYQVIRVYVESPTPPGRPRLEYPDLRPTLASIAAHAPAAVVNTLTRPWVGESRLPFYVAAGLENLALLGLLTLAVVAVVRGRAGGLPFELGFGLSIFCLILAILMGVTTPNLGSLNRYRSELLPFFLLLVLQNDYAAGLLRRLRLGGGPQR